MPQSKPFKVLGTTRYSDTLDKVIGKYLACVCSHPFDYEGQHCEPKILRVSPDIFRGYTCPERCGACCSKFTLDYLPDAAKFGYRPLLSLRMVNVSGKRRRVYTDAQRDNEGHHCRHLDLTNGRCLIHGHHPFSCDFELLRFIVYAGDRPNILTAKLYGRGWAMLRADSKTRGARCEMTPPTSESVHEVERKLVELRDWAQYFGTGTKKLDKIIPWVRTGPHHRPLYV